MFAVGVVITPFNAIIECMRKALKSHLIALALVFIINQALLLVHEVSHVDKGNTPCHVCFSQSHQSHALPATPLYDDAGRSTGSQPETAVPLHVVSDRALPYQQRAPPEFT